MVFLRKSLLATLMQIFVMLRHLFAEILRLEFDDYRVIRTRASDLKHFWAVYMTLSKCLPVRVVKPSERSINYFNIV